MKSYAISNDVMEWSDGNRFCDEQFGTTLATITNDGDAQIFYDLYEKGSYVWVGLSESGGVWSWASGYQWYVYRH